MIENYFKIAWRNLKRNKGFFALNFIGLYISVVVCAVIALIILHELSFDKNTDEKLALYRVVNQFTSSTGKTFNPVTPYPLAKAMRTQMPEEKLISQIHFHKDAFVTIGEKKMKENNIVFADSVFPLLFTLKVQKGNLAKALSQPGFAVLTQSSAKKYFSKDDPIGKRIKLDNLLELEVAAVINDAPANTHLLYNMLVPYVSLKPEYIGNLPLDQWGINSGGFTYIAFTNNKNTKQAEAV
jgi:putative ABC transport system permease protein